MNRQGRIKGRNHLKPKIMDQKINQSFERILAFDPNYRGFGWAVLETEPLTLVDWGISSCKREKGNRCTAVIDTMIQVYDPSIVVIEDCAGMNTVRCKAIRSMLNQITRTARRLKKRVVRISRNDVRLHFAKTGATTKQAIAEDIAERFPELKPWLPKPRELGYSEEYNMSIFDAVAIGLALLDEE